MAYIEPNTEVRFLHDVPLDPDYENTLYFDNITQQTEYFINKSIRVFPGLTYQRKNRGWLRVGWNADPYGGSAIKDMYSSTYMMFKNSNFENKWFYAFVDKVEYVNNNTVDVRYHIDVLQTWHFDYTFNQCFIVRQHASNDNVGANTIPEELEQGPYICDRPPYKTILGTDILGGDFQYTPGILLATSFDPFTLDYAKGRVLRGWSTMGNYFSGIYYRTFSLSTQDINDLNDFLEHVANDEALADGVVSMSMIPLSLVDPTGDDYSYNDILFTRPNSLGSYTPRNKKLLTNPYNFLYVTNNQGNAAEYHWEDSYNLGYLEFRVWANYSTTPAMLGAPVEYKLPSHTGNYDEMLTVNNFPLCAWTNDAFKAWLAQNIGTIAGVGVGILSSWVGTGISAMRWIEAGRAAQRTASYNPFTGQSGMVNPEAFANADRLGSETLSKAGHALTSTALALGQLYDHSRKPPQANGNSNGNLIYQSGLMTFSFYRKYIKPEYAAIIDKYFDMYGYNVHTVGTPNRAVRRCYTYVKTSGCNIHGNIPADDITTIQELFDKGIRFWRHTAVYGNYDPSVNDNTI